MRNRMRRALAFAAMLPALFILTGVAEVPAQLPDPDGEPPAAGNPGPKTSATKPAHKNVKLPGQVISFQERCVDLEANSRKGLP